MGTFGLDVEAIGRGCGEDSCIAVESRGIRRWVLILEEDLWRG